MKRLAFSIVLTLTSFSLVAQWTPNSDTTKIHFNGGSVGIGVSVPADLLHLSGGYLRMEMSGGASFKFVPHASENSLGVYDVNNSAYRLWINPSGYIGIGTQSPTRPLHVVAGNGGNDVATFESTDGIANIYIKDNAGASRILHVGDQLKLRANDTADQLIIDGGTNDIQLNSDGLFVQGSTRNVGIGTDAPNYKLDVNGTYNAVGIRVNANDANSKYFMGSGNVTGDVQLLSSIINATGNVAAYVRNYGTGGALSEMNVAGPSAGDAWSVYAVSGSTNWMVGLDNSDDDKFKIGPYLSPSDGSLMTMTTNGKVGIGTTNPGSLLTLQGDWANSQELLRFNLEQGRDWVFEQAGAALRLKSLALKDFHIETTSLRLNYPGDSYGLIFEPGRASTFRGGKIITTSGFDHSLTLENNGTGNYHLKVLGTADASEYLVNGTTLGSVIAGNGLSWNATTGKLDIGGSGLSVKGSLEVLTGEIVLKDTTYDVSTNIYFDPTGEREGLAGVIFNDEYGLGWKFMGGGEISVEGGYSSANWGMAYDQRGSVIAGNGLTWNAATGKLDLTSGSAINEPLEIRYDYDLNPDPKAGALVFNDISQGENAMIYLDFDQDALRYTTSAGNRHVFDHSLEILTGDLKIHSMADTGNRLVQVNSDGGLEPYLSTSSLDSAIVERGSAIAGNGLAWNATTGKLDATSEDSQWEYNSVHALLPTGSIGLGSIFPNGRVDVNGTRNSVGVRVTSNKNNDHLFLGSGNVTGDVNLFNSNIHAAGRVIGSVRNYGSGGAQAVVESGGVDAGDAWTTYSLYTNTKWSVGLDNDDEDKFKIGIGSQLDNTSLMTMTTDYKVGIGTAAPNHTLDVAGQVSAQQFLINGNNFGSTLAGNGLAWNAGTGQLDLSNDLSLTGQLQLGTEILADGTSGRLSLYQSDSLRMKLGVFRNKHFSELGHSFFYNNTLQMALVEDKVGIGTDTPGELLEITSDNNPTLAIGASNTDTGGKSTLKFQAGNGTSNNGFLMEYNRLGSDDYLAFKDGSLNERMVIRNGGAVGIGDSNPNARLSVKGSQSGSAATSKALRVLDAGNAETFSVGDNGQVTVGSLASTTYDFERFVVTGSTGLTAMSVEGAQNGEAVYSFREKNVGIAASIVWSGAEDQLVFESEDGSDMIFSPLNGNVGVGNFAPDHKLDVAGAVNATEYLVNGQPLQAGLWTAEGNDIVFDSGNVGIGSESPSAKLEVAGTSKFTGDMAVDGKIESTRVTVTQTPGNWPDYVFKPGYNLLSLNQVESFINKNGHLPNVPKAEVVEKEGQDLGDIQARLLEKVEELMLYTIEQQKEIEALKKELKALKKKD